MSNAEQAKCYRISQDGVQKMTCPERVRRDGAPHIEMLQNPVPILLMLVSSVLSSLAIGIILIYTYTFQHYITENPIATVMVVFVLFAISVVLGREAYNRWE